MAGAGSGTILGGGNKLARRSIPLHRPRDRRPPLCRRPRYAACRPGRERHQDRADNRRPTSWDARILRMEQGQAVRHGRPRYRRQPESRPYWPARTSLSRASTPARTPSTSTGAASEPSTSPCPDSAPTIQTTTCAVANSSSHPRPVCTSTAVLTAPKAPASSPCLTRACLPPWSQRQPLPPRCFTGRRTGEVQNVVVPIYDAMFTAMGSTIVSRPDIPAGPAPLSPAIGRFYRCADGRWINLNASYERSLRPLLDAMGHPEWYDALTDDRLRQNVEEREEWAARFREPWLERAALEWESLMAEAGVPLTMCRTLQEWMETEHARESGAVVEIDDPTYGPMRQVGIQVRLSDTPGGPPSPAPALGQHNNPFGAPPFHRVGEVCQPHLSASRGVDSLYRSGNMTMVERSWHDYPRRGRNPCDGLGDRVSDGASALGYQSGPCKARKRTPISGKSTHAKARRSLHRRHWRGCRYHEALAVRLPTELRGTNRPMNPKQDFKRPRG